MFFPSVFQIFLRLSELEPLYMHITFYLRQYGLGIFFRIAQKTVLLLMYSNRDVTLILYMINPHFFTSVAV
jgi:hypothetical protein